MSPWESLLGHSEQRELFRRSAARQRLSHAYMLSGPAGIGKRLFAQLLAQSVFCREHGFAELNCCGECRACRGFSAGTWPDFLQVGVPAGKNVIPISKMVGEEGRRGKEGLCYELSMSPQASDRRVAIIDDAQKMSPESANALLKTLEEPPARSLILLICDHPDNLLPTIRSRCQNVRFFPLTEVDLKELLIKNEMAESEEEAAAVAGLAEGSLETAGQLLNPDLRQMRKSITIQLGQMEAMKPLQVSEKVIKGLEELSTAAPEQRRNAQWLLRFVADAIQARLRGLATGDLSDPLTKRLGARKGVDLLAPMLARTLEASRQLDGYTPMKLVMEALFDDIARMFRESAKRG